MMHVKTMALIVDATARGGIPEVVMRACGRWTPDPGTLKYVRSSNTHVFRFERHGEGRFLRLTPASERSRSDLDGELDFIFHLNRRHVPVAVPLPSKSGLMVEEVAVSNEPHYAVVFRELSGKQVELTEEDPAIVRAWGENLGRLHTASRGFVPAAAGTTRSWEDDLRQAKTWLPGQEEAACRALAELGTWLRELPIDETNFGMIHFDFDEDNLFWNGTVCKICDFECSARYWYAADIAFTLCGLRHKTPEQRRRLLTWFLEGYCESADPGRDCEQSVTGFVKFSVAYHFANRHTNPSDDADWLAKMRRRHDAWIAKTRKFFGEPWEWQ
jgi:Ser/Thr protein kinase RdoA (MazF antagonist)